MDFRFLFGDQNYTLEQNFTHIERISLNSVNAQYRPGRIPNTRVAAAAVAERMCSLTDRRSNCRTVIYSGTMGTYTTRLA